MSRTASRTPAPPTSPQPVAVGPVAAPRVVGQRRIRGGHLGLAVALIAIGGLLAAFAFYSATRTGDYLAVARPVAAGTKITSADLVTVQINNAVGLKPVPAGDRNRVIGQRAKVTLVPGALLTADQVTDTELVGPGQRQVGIGLKPERMPARRLNPGDKVVLVATADPNAPAPTTTGGTGDDQGRPRTFGATVVDFTPQAEGEANVVVYVAVNDGDAAQVVELATASRIGIVLAGTR